MTCRQDRGGRILRAINDCDRNALAAILRGPSGAPRIDEDYYSALYGLATGKRNDGSALAFGLETGAQTLGPRSFKDTVTRLFIALMHNDKTTKSAMSVLARHLPEKEKAGIYDRCLAALFKRAVWLDMHDDAPSGIAAAFLVKEGARHQGIVFREKFEILSFNGQSDESRQRAQMRLERLRRFQSKATRQK